MSSLRHHAQRLLAAGTVLLTLATGASGAPAEPWPTLLGAREAFPPEVSATVERLWIEPTLTRTVAGRSARVPFDVYVAFLDTPEVTASAARFRKLASFEIQALDDDRYRASDGNGASGIAQVLRRDPRRLVVLSRGEHTGPILGTISGSALTILNLETRGAWSIQRSRLTYTSTTASPPPSPELSSRPSGSLPTVSSARGFASRRKLPSGRSTDQAASVSGSPASRSRPRDAPAFWSPFPRASHARAQKDLVRSRVPDLQMASRRGLGARGYLHAARGASGPLRGTSVQAKVAGCVRYSTRRASRRWRVRSRRARPMP